jgi:hypothetical protein
VIGTTVPLCDVFLILGVERKWGQSGKMFRQLALEGHPNEMDDSWGKPGPAGLKSPPHPLKSERTASLVQGFNKPAATRQGLPGRHQRSVEIRSP